MITLNRLAGALAGFAATAMALTAEAHDFWVQPLKFWIPPDSAVVTTLQVGHGPARERWDVDAARVKLFRSIGPGEAVTDHRAALGQGVMDRDHRIVLTAPGTHVLVLETSHAQSTLPGPRFTAYLKEEGLTPALLRRQRDGTESQPGREIYSRRAKSIVQVGPASNRPQPWVTRALGLTLEIVPEVNPYALGAGETLPVRVFYEGKPLAGATVKLNNLAADAKPVVSYRTDARGRAVFRIPRRGAWQLNVLWTKPVTASPEADFDTTFSSLTLGFQ